MWRALSLLLMLAACAQLPPTPEDVEAKRFQPVADKAVVYIARPSLDSYETGGLILDGYATLTFQHATYYRWEAAPGVHRIEGDGPSTIRLTLNAEPGRIYYFMYTVLGTMRTGAAVTALQAVDEKTGRDLVLRATMLP